MKKATKKVPGLNDLRRTVPPGGLLDPVLREGVGKLNLGKIKKDIYGK